MTPILLCLNQVCPAHDEVFVDEAMHCVMGRLHRWSQPKSVRRRWSFDDGQSSLCDAEWIVVPSEAAP